MLAFSAAFTRGYLAGFRCTPTAAFYEQSPGYPIYPTPVPLDDGTPEELGYNYGMTIGVQDRGCADYGHLDGGYWLEHRHTESGIDRP